MSALLHVLDGDAIVEEFRAAGLVGEHVVWREGLIEGPWPRPLRGVHEALRAAHEARTRGDEIVLWFDDDLFCRLHAAFFAAEFAGARLTNALGSHADRSDLAALLERRVALDPALAEAWHAYVSPDPRALVPLAARFPWLRLHVERFPHADDGLSALERRVLATLRDEGPLAFEELFRRVATGDFSATRFGLGDTELARTLAELGPIVTQDALVAITHEGRQVLTGHAERTAHAPLDRWLGGVHLAGAGAWRWDGNALLPKP